MAFSTRRRVLVVAYYFPPQGGAGTQRAAKLVEYLPRFGYEPVVITTTAGVQTASAPTSDPTLLKDVPPVPICRIPDGHLSAGVRLQRALRFDPDEIGWATRAAAATRAAIRTYRPDAVVVTVSPYAAALIGTEARRAGIPFVLDLRDPWALDGWRVQPTIVHGVADRARMRRSLRRADLVVANTPAARVAYIELADLDPDRIVTIPNGFDPADLPSVENRHRGAEFVIGHAGTLHDPSPPLAQGPKARLRWRWRRVDEAGRSARYLIEALALTRGAGASPPGPVRLELVGHVHPGHLRLAQRLGVESRIVERGYEPHATAIAILSRADMIFVPLHGVPSGERALVVPGKLYEALATGRRLLAALPEGDAADLVRLTGAGSVVAPGDVEGLRSAIEDEREAVGDGARAGAPAALLVPFTRGRLVERFADALDAARTGRPQRSDDPWQEARGLAEANQGVVSGAE